MMRYFFAILMLFMFLFIGIAEAKLYNSSQIKAYVDRTPRDAEDYVSSLANYLTKPFDDDYDKAKAIAFWIASRINYDEYLYRNGKTSRLINSYKGQNPNELLKSRVGICGDFAELFMALCKRAGVRARLVTGYTYPSDRYLSAKQKRNSGHAWNYFMYKGKKIYVDTTFMAKGRTGSSGLQNNQNRRRALNKVRRDNKRKSRINDFDEFYFDFDYKKEEKIRKHERKER